MKAIANDKQYYISKDGKVLNVKTNKYLSTRLNKRGYVLVDIKGKPQYLHRLLASAYLGDVHCKQVDHIDKDKQNNNLDNLRICTRSQNRANSYKRAGANTSKYKGVSWHKAAKKWHARCYLNNKCYHVGYFLKELDASRAYNEYAGRLHGNYAVLNA